MKKEKTKRGVNHYCAVTLLMTLTMHKIFPHAPIFLGMSNISLCGKALTP